MVTSVESAKLKLQLATGLDSSEIKLMLKDLYKKIEELEDEIRKISQNRPRANKPTGNTL